MKLGSRVAVARGELERWQRQRRERHGKTDVALASEQEPAQEPDELLGSFVGFGAVEARYTSGPTLANVVYPPVPGQMIYRVDPVTGVNVERIA